jgi:adenylyltransferase/sulfurtransferase
LSRPLLKQLTDEERERYARQIALQEIGSAGQMKFKAARVCLVGLGGLGCPIALKLAGLGIGYIRIVDRDVVSITDLHRQYLYDVDDAGLPKVEAAAAKLSRLNPQIEIDPKPVALVPSTSHGIIEGCDLVIDGLDNVTARHLLNRACVEQKIPYIFGGAIELQGNASTIIPEKTACFDCFFPRVEDRDIDRCATVGVHPSILGIISSIQVLEATRLLTGKEPLLLNRLFYADLTTLSFNTFKINRVEGCPVCGKDRKPMEKTGEKLIVEESCGRDGRATYTITSMEPAELNIPALSKIVEGRGYLIKTTSNLSVSFDLDPRIRVCVMKSGNGVAQVKPPRSKNDREQILELYKSLLGKLGQ